MSILDFDERQLDGLGQRARRCCVVFYDHPLPSGVSPSTGRVGVEHDGQRFVLLLDRTHRYDGGSSSVRSLVEAGSLPFETISDLGGWLAASCISQRASAVVAEPADVASSLEEFLLERVIDQDHAVLTIASSCGRHLAKSEPRAPLVILAGGPTGTGKTHTAETLAAALRQLYADTWGTVRVDCNEFEERHRVASLLGSPPGYIGSSGTPEFLEQLSATPASVVILDEFEKAHPDVARAFMGAFDSGRLRPANGSPTIDVRRSIFFVTTNLADDQFADYERDNRGAGVVESDEVYRRLLVGGGLDAAMVGRVDVVVPYRPLSSTARAAMVISLIRDVATEYGVTVNTVDPEIGVRVLDRLREHDPFGARTLRRIIDAELGPVLRSCSADHLNDLVWAATGIAATESAAVTRPSPS